MIDLQSRRFTRKDLEAAVSYNRVTAFPRARSVEARRSPMPSGREEPDYNLLRPVQLSVMPATGAPGCRSLSPHWSMEASGSDPEEEPGLDTSPLPERKMKPRLVVRGDDPKMRRKVEDYRRFNNE